MSDSRFQAALGEGSAPHKTGSKSDRPAADFDDRLADYDPHLPQGDIMGSANAAIWTSMSALLCAAVGPFTCYTSYLLSLGLGAVAVWQSSKVLKVPGNDPEVRTARTLTYASLTGGIIATLMSAGFVLIFLMIMLMYVGMFFLAIVGAALGG